MIKASDETAQICRLICVLVFLATYRAPIKASDETAHICRLIWVLVFLATYRAPIKASDGTAQICRLIWVFDRRTYQATPFAGHQLLQSTHILVRHTYYVTVFKLMACLCSLPLIDDIILTDKRNALSKSDNILRRKKWQHLKYIHVYKPTYLLNKLDK